MRTRLFGNGPANVVRGVALGLVAVPFGTVAQPPPRAARIGLLATASQKVPEYGRRSVAFWQGLRERGYVDGQNIVIEVRTHRREGRALFGPGKGTGRSQGRSPSRVQFDLRPGRAASDRHFVPIVVAVMGDPVGDGLVDSLAEARWKYHRVDFLSPHNSSRSGWHLLKEALPKASRICGPLASRCLRRANDERHGQGGRGSRLGLWGYTSKMSPYKEPGDFDRAFATISKEHPDGVLLCFQARCSSMSEDALSVRRTRQRLPSMFAERAFVGTGWAHVLWIEH